MRWSYDPQVDALTITLIPGRRSARTDELRPGMLCDIDRAGHPIAIEILDASSHFSRSSLSHLPLPQVMVPLSEASRSVGLDPATLRQQIRNRRLRATKHHREWWVRPAALKEYLDSRAPQGRRSSRKQSSKRDSSGR
jgi:uncharacterized protein YuzE